MTESTGDAAQFQEIHATRCRELLAHHHTGRVAWSAPDGPELLPVTYAVHNGDVVFRTSPYGAMAQLAEQRCPVAFEIDDIDREQGSGWSVVVRGTTRGVVPAHELVTLWTVDGIEPRATGIRNAFVAITPRTISGRVVKAPAAD
jgi:nitroimidazol reductase NimA-like FMN-containing flavoprotein (pyridoxamine 5'-phosphate oxidase superfamily)